MFIFKNIILFRVIILLVLTAFTGCVTSRIEYTETNELPKDKVYRISDIFMNDGTIIDMQGKEAKFKLKYKGMDNVIIYYDAKDNVQYILLKDVNNVKIEVLESNIVVNVLIIVSSIILFFLILFWITQPFEGMKMG